MRRWISVTFTVWIAFNLLIIGSIGLGRVQSAPDSFKAPQIGYCENAPCVQGVIPGVTTWDDVTARFPSAVDSTGTISLDPTGLIQTTFTSDSQGDKVDTIRVTFSVPYVTLATLLTQFGVPCKVRVYQSGGVQVLYPQLTANLMNSEALASTDVRFASDVTISELDFMAEPNSCALQTADPANLYQDADWRGFTELNNN